MSDKNEFYQKHPLRFMLFAGVVMASCSMWIVFIFPLIGVPSFLIGIIFIVVAILGKIGKIITKLSMKTPQNDFVRKMTTPVYKQE